MGFFRHDFISIDFPENEVLSCMLWALKRCPLVRGPLLRGVSPKIAMFTARRQSCGGIPVAVREV